MHGNIEQGCSTRSAHVSPVSSFLARKTLIARGARPHPRGPVRSHRLRKGRSEPAGSSIGPQGFKPSEVPVVGSPPECMEKFVVQDKLRICIPSLAQQVWMQVHRFNDKGTVDPSPPTRHAVSLRGASPQDTKRQVLQRQQGLRFDQRQVLHGPEDVFTELFKSDLLLRVRSGHAVRLTTSDGMRGGLP